MYPIQKRSIRMAKTNQEKDNRQHQQIQKLEASIFLLSSELKLSKNYQEVLKLLHSFDMAYRKSANEKNNRLNKNIIGWGNFWDMHKSPKRSLNAVQKKAKLKRISRPKKPNHKDFIDEYQVLHFQGFSLQQIVQYSAENFGCKVSKSTIQKIIKEVKNNASQ